MQLTIQMHSAHQQFLQDFIAINIAFLSCNFSSWSMYNLQVVKLFAEAMKYSGDLDAKSLFHYRQFGGAKSS